MKATVVNPPAEVTPCFEGLERTDLLAVHRCMLLSRKIDDKEIQLKNQSQIFFQISGAGHEAVLAAAGMCLKPAYDWFFPYYRDRALCLSLGVTPLEMFLQAVAAADDPASRGRQMPSHWGSTRVNIVSQGSATGSQCLHAVGCAQAALLYETLPGIEDRDSRFKADEVAYVSIGDGTTHRESHAIIMDKAIRAENVREKIVHRGRGIAEHWRLNSERGVHGIGKISNRVSIN